MVFNQAEFDARRKERMKPKVAESVEYIRGYLTATSAGVNDNISDLQYAASIISDYGDESDFKALYPLVGRLERCMKEINDLQKNMQAVLAGVRDTEVVYE